VCHLDELVSAWSNVLVPNRRVDADDDVVLGDRHVHRPPLVERATGTCEVLVISPSVTSAMSIGLPDPTIAISIPIVVVESANVQVVIGGTSTTRWLMLSVGRTTPASRFRRIRRRGRRRR
jgi:hypothetical protein